ncbi:hypothetical protein CDN99_20825 [Roseateles aquatilis]|uniref:Uncharacterized protein n=1 Tax=Roseateles aquatilis TaxID=431061 RepID=A0A246J0Z8_9BURK|nr:hypothetical protein [Roseateles aquatilis]OWQ86278.1 hypothetical protein CDN99_20825 [Roseateles aquatilis]
MLPIAPLEAPGPRRLGVALSALLLAACSQLPTTAPAPAPSPGGPFSPAALQALRPAQFRSTVGSSTEAQDRLTQDRAKIRSAVTGAASAPQDAAALGELARALRLVAHYRTDIDIARPALLASLPALDRQPTEIQRPLLTAAYTLYAADAAPLLRDLLPRLATPREFAIAAYALMQTRQPADLALIQSQLAQRDRGEPRLQALALAVAAAQGVAQPARPPLADLLAVRPGYPVVFSFQRPGRQQMGLALVRQADGRFVRRPDGGLFNIEQLALSSSGLPGTITLGNTPQGLFTIQGAGRAATNIWIGPTPYLHTKVPGEASVAEYEQRAPGPYEPPWTLDRYRALLPASWRDYAPLQEAWLAGRAGRDEMLMHGSTIDPRYYAGNRFYPGTPSDGCLVAMEYWAPNGTMAHSDQIALLQAFTAQGRDRGYMVLVELDAGPTPVALAEVIGAVLDVEARTSPTASR